MIDLTFVGIVVLLFYLPSFSKVHRCMVVIGINGIFTADVAATVDNEDALIAAVAVLVEAAAPGETIPPACAAPPFAPSPFPAKTTPPLPDCCEEDMDNRFLLKILLPPLEFIDLFVFFAFFFVVVVVVVVLMLLLFTDEDALLEIEVDDDVVDDAGGMMTVP